MKNYTPVSFDVSRYEASLITDIVKRAKKIFDKNIDTLSLDMDLTATHANGCPLKLHVLLDAGELDFSHDLLGIVRHIDRTTGKLTDCFLPRFAL